MPAARANINSLWLAHYVFGETWTHGTCGSHMNMQVFAFKMLAVLVYSYCFAISFIFL